MDPLSLELECLSEPMAVCRLGAQDPIPQWATESPFFSISRTGEELSIVCQQSHVPAGVKSERGWRCFRVKGPLDFGLNGILASLVTPLAEAKISVFSLSTYDTDYVMIKQQNAEPAITTWLHAGHRVQTALSN